MGTTRTGPLFPVKLARIALIGNHLPRMCGIATFTTDLQEAISRIAPDTESWVVAMNDPASAYEYPPPVQFEVNQNRLADYQLAADFVNINRVEVACLQHEFGIFGGKWGSHILAFLQELRIPALTTLHTVLQEPEPEQEVVMKKLIELSGRVAVLSRFSEETLRERYRLEEGRIVRIPHGIPDIPFLDPESYKEQFGVEGRKVVMSFGLLSPGKGLEQVIDALPAVVSRYPEAVYLIVGGTHPQVRRQFGESYRLSLQQRARKLKVDRHVVFHNRFVSRKELCDFLICADVYVTPYLHKQQAVSGTLAYAMGAGKAIVSTPFWYAEEMLAEGRGLLVPFGDASAIASQLIRLFGNQTELNAMRQRAYAFSRQMVWEEVARRYLLELEHLKQERMGKIQPVRATGIPAWTSYDLPELKLDHLRLLTDDTGILQHARFTIPDRSRGYTTDDNARALIAVLMAQDKLPDEDLPVLAGRYLGFLNYAFNEQAGRFRNFLGYDRSWQEEIGSEDCHGRALWALGTAVAISPLEGQRAMALELFERALPAIEELQASRSLSFAIVGIGAYLQRFSGDLRTRRFGESAALRLFGRVDPEATGEWPWIEDRLTYANANIPHALIAAGGFLGREDMLKAGLRLLQWLVEVQKERQGYFVPVGNREWFRRGGDRSRFDQQPIEASTTIGACLAAYEATREERWSREAVLCFEWFLGRNDLQQPLFDYLSGGCRDGLQANTVNLNQGAESTLSWLIALLSMYNLHSQAVSLEGKRFIPAAEASNPDSGHLGGLDNR
jgi:glycosyltransferase involved in cell wall biosynthesis